MTKNNLGWGGKGLFGFHLPFTVHVKWSQVGQESQGGTGVEATDQDKDLQACLQLNLTEADEAPLLYDCNLLNWLKPKQAKQTKLSKQTKTYLLARGPKATWEGKDLFQLPLPSSNPLLKKSEQELKQKLYRDNAGSLVPDFLTRLRITRSTDPPTGQSEGDKPPAEVPSNNSSLSQINNCSHLGVCKPLLKLIITLSIAQCSPATDCARGGHTVFAS